MREMRKYRMFVFVCRSIFIFIESLPVPILFISAITRRRILTHTQVDYIRNGNTTLSKTHLDPSKISICDILNRNNFSVEINGNKYVQRIFEHTMHQCTSNRNILSPWIICHMENTCAHYFRYINFMAALQLNFSPDFRIKCCSRKPRDKWALYEEKK